MDVDTHQLDGCTCVVTGANTGIGRVTAEGLAARGARVVLACRSAERTQPVIAELARRTGNDDLEHLPLDLADLESVRAAAKALVARGDPIAVLVANAGLAGQRGLTAQGFELAFGTNHLGHFLFVTSLLPLLRAAAPARVVVVSSGSHLAARGIDEARLRRPTRTLTGMREYEVSKLANVLFTQELARRVPAAEVGVHALHPGVVASDIWRRVPWPVRPLLTRRMLTTEQGAATSLWCATAAELEGHSGGYYENCAPAPVNPVATPELAGWLWQMSEAWTAPGAYDQH